jgi:hypothetical protein
VDRERSTELATRPSVSNWSSPVSGSNRDARILVKKMLFGRGKIH